MTLPFIELKMIYINSQLIIYCLYWNLYLDNIRFIQLFLKIESNYFIRKNILLYI